MTHQRVQTVGVGQSGRREGADMSVTKDRCEVAGMELQGNYVNPTEPKALPPRLLDE